MTTNSYVHILEKTQGCYEVVMGRRGEEWPQPRVEGSWDGCEKNNANPHLWHSAVPPTAGAGCWGSIQQWESHLITLVSLRIDSP
jgi:hypothetical protein